VIAVSDSSPLIILSRAQLGLLREFYLRMEFPSASAVIVLINQE
jgi:hypothetical protein